MCWAYTDPAPPPVARGGTVLSIVEILSDDSPMPLKRCHDNIPRPEKYLPPFRLVPAQDVRYALILWYVAKIIYSS